MWGLCVYLVPLFTWPRMWIRMMSFKVTKNGANRQANRQSYKLWFVEWRHFHSDLERLRTQVSRSRHYLRDGTRYRHIYNEMLIGTYSLLKDVISNDLEWLSEIFSDMKHRAVFATAELLVSYCMLRIFHIICCCLLILLLIFYDTVLCQECSEYLGGDC